MAYSKTQWQDHVTQYTNRYDQTENADGSINLAKVQGEVIQQGTPMSAENFNKLENGVESAHDDLATHMEDSNVHTTTEEKLLAAETAVDLSNHVGNNGIHLAPEQKDDLVNGGDSEAHYHSSDRDRENHSGTQTSATISDFAASVRTTILTGLSTATNAVILAADTVIVALGKLQKQISDHFADNTTHTRFGTTTGTANTYVLTLSPAPTLVTGLNIMAKINVANTGASTINVNGLGVKAIVDVNGLALTSGALKIDMIYNLVYNGTSFVVEGYEALKSTVDAHGTRLDLQERVLTSIIPATGWSGTAPYYVSVTVPGLTNSRPDIHPIYTEVIATAIAEHEAWNTISMIECTANTLTIYCFEAIPSTPINIELVGG